MHDPPTTRRERDRPIVSPPTRTARPAQFIQDGTTTVPPSAQAGLTSAAVARARSVHGPNLLPAPPARHPLWCLVKQFTHLFAAMLWAAAGLALLAGMPQLSIAVVIVVLVNGLFAFAQEYRADRAAARLRGLVPARATVVRDGRPCTVPVADVVPGDLVVLTAGERICADLTLVECHALSVDASMLTGESVPERPLADDRVWCGTFVVEGEAHGVVTATGSHTRFAGIAALTLSAEPGTSPLTVQLRRVVHTVSGLAAVVGVCLFVVALLLGLTPSAAFLFGLGVTVALVPEGLLPTVTLSLARAAQQMAHHRVLVRRLEAVETLGATTYICTDKTGTLTLNQMSVVKVWTPTTGDEALDAVGYDPTTPLGHQPGPAATAALNAAASCVRGRSVQSPTGEWRPHGDPMDVALDVAACRSGHPAAPTAQIPRRLPYTAARRRSSVVLLDEATPRVVTIGAPESVAEVLTLPPRELTTVVGGMAREGLRVIAVASRAATDWRDAADADLEQGLTLLGVVGLEDPPRPDVSAAVARCQRAGIRIAVITGDHPATALAIARQVGLADPETPALTAAELPTDSSELAELFSRPGGLVVARVNPEDKLRIARALRERGHVVAMTGDGVNDGPALRAADVGVAMGASGSDVAREAADIVLLDDHFASIVDAIELGRSTFTNIRRFLTYHLTDNVAELAPFVVWALSTGQFPLAIGVMQVLALDIGTDMLPALALGAEPPHRGAMDGPVRRSRLIDRSVLTRAFLVLGPAEAVGSMATFAAVLWSGGWRLGAVPELNLLTAASGAAFMAIAAGQLANAVACRSATMPAWTRSARTNRLLGAALFADAAVCVAFVTVPPLPATLGGTWPPALGLVGAAATAGLVVLVDSLHKRHRAVVRERGGRSA